MFLPDEHRTMHFKTTGVVVYDPVRAGKVMNDNGWCVIDIIPSELLEYYSFQFYKKFGILLDKPSWSPHISVLVGEDSFDSSIPWKYKDGDLVEVSYSHYLFWNKEHVWVAADSPAVSEIRQHYNAQNKDRGHITVGRIPQKKKGVIPEFSSFKDLDKWHNFPFNKPLI